MDRQEQEKALRLKHIGYGNYKDPKGNIWHWDKSKFVKKIYTKATDPFESKPATKDPEILYSRLKESNFEEISGIDLGNAEKYKILGAGFFGTAFLAADNKVVKITDDKKEANTTVHLAGKNLPGIINIHGVYRKKLRTPTEFHAKQPLDYRYVITMDLVSSDEDRAVAAALLFKEVLANEDGYAELDEIEIDSDNFTEEYYDSVIFEIEKSDYTKQQKSDLKRIALGLRSLNKEEITYMDVHSGNIGFDSKTGELVLIDIGVSYSNRPKEETEKKYKQFESLE